MDELGIKILFSLITIILVIIAILLFDLTKRIEKLEE